MRQKSAHLLKLFKKRTFQRIETRLRLLDPDQRIQVADVLSGNWQMLKSNLRILLGGHKSLRQLHIENEYDFFDLCHQDKVIWIGAHQGCFEYLPQCMAAKNLAVDVPYINRGKGQKFWNWLRCRKSKFIHPVPPVQLRRQMRKWINEGGRITTLCDQGQSKIYGKVLGESTPFALQIPMHLRHHGWKVVFFRVLAMGQKDVLEWHELPYQDSLNISYAQFLEEGILRAPEQWVWHYPLHFPKLPQFLRQAPKAK